MKIFKRLRGFFQKRIPFLRSKKKDKSANISVVFEEVNEIETSNQVSEFAPELSVKLDESLEHIRDEFKNDKVMATNRNRSEENKNGTMSEGAQFSAQKVLILEDPFLPEKLKGYSKDDKVMTPNTDEVKENEEISEEGVQFPPQNIMISENPLSPERLEKNFKNDKILTSTRGEFKEDNKVTYHEGAKISYNKNVILDDPSSPDRLKRDCKKDTKITPNKDEFIDVKKEISRKSVPCPIEKFMLWDGPMVKERDKSSQGDKLEAEEKSASSECENEKAEGNRQMSGERCELSKCSWNPEQNLNFEVDFENAFGKNLTETDAEESWHRVASTNTENVCEGSKQTYHHQFPLEKDNIIDAQFDAFFGLGAKIYEDNRLANVQDVFPENMHRNGFCKTQKKIDDHYDFEDDYDEFSDEEKSLKTDEEKKLMVVIKDRPSKNQKLFQYSDVHNMTYIRDIKDPLMKKYYSDGDLSRKAPYFFMAFSERKE